MIRKYAEKLYDLFHGLERAHGVYINKSKNPKTGEKVEGKCSTIPNLVTVELWEDHLEGRKGLGIIPIRDDATCFFGAIDIDVYIGLDYSIILEQIKKFSLPLVPCRSKSGGIHCFLFTKEAVPALLMKEKLSMFASILGFGNSEIFPKQTEILADRGDLGQWLNMPYFNYENTNRYGLKNEGLPMNIEEFIKVCVYNKLTMKELELFNIASVSDISDGPPCLQNLLNVGFMPGVRNNSLFNIGVYLKKKDEGTYEQLLDSYNLKYMNPPLLSTEIQVVIKSLHKKEYNFTCDKAPFKNYCNQTLCRTRPFGIGQIIDMPQLNGLTKFSSTPPVWFIDVEGFGRMELTTEELQCQIKFQRRCMEALNQMPPVVKTAVWQKLIHELLKNVNLIEVPDDASPKGIFYLYLEQFCTSRMQARSMDEILLGKPWLDNNTHYFRIIDLMAFLDRHRFYEFKLNKVCAMIKDRGGESIFIKIKEKGLNVWKMPTFTTINKLDIIPEMENNIL